MRSTSPRSTSVRNQSEADKTEPDRQQREDLDARREYSKAEAQQERDGGE
jgi:hypothetical protein